MTQHQGHHNGREFYLLIWAANPKTGAQGVVGPATSFRAVGPSLRAPQGRELAHFRDGIWRRRKIGGEFSLLWTEEITSLQFEDPYAGTNHVAGPFEMVGIVCDTIYADVEYSRPIACLDPATGKWRSSIDGTLWPEIVFTPAKRPVIVSGEMGTPATISNPTFA